jgi:hypothetical protein
MQDHGGRADAHCASYVADGVAMEAQSAPRPPVMAPARSRPVWRSAPGSGLRGQRLSDCRVHLRFVPRGGGLQIAFRGVIEAISNGWPLPLRRTGLASSGDGRPSFGRGRH